MKYLLCSLILAFALVVSGCATKEVQGNKNLEGVTVTEIQNKIKPNITTKQDIENWLGTPTGIGQDKDGNEEWTYKMSSSSSKSNGAQFIPVVGAFMRSNESSGSSRMLVISYNKTGIVTKYHLETDEHKHRY